MLELATWARIILAQIYAFLFCNHNFILWFCFLSLELDISSEKVSVNFRAHEANPGENTSYFSEMLFVMD